MNIKKRIIITGGAGFIGIHATRIFAKKGFAVRVIDNLSTGSLENIKALQNEYDSIEFIQGCITDAKLITETINDAYLILHLAAVSSVPQAEVNPTHTYNVNVCGLHHIVQRATINKMRLLFASSAAIYGRKSEKLRETTSPLPCSWYGTTKLIGEEIIRAACTTSSLQAKSLRFFNVIGQGQSVTGPSAGVISIWKHALEHNLPIVIQGNGMQTRDFIAVEQLMHAIYTISHLEKKYYDGRPINICTGESMTLLEMLMRMKNEYPEYSASITHAPARNGDIQHSDADATELSHIIPHWPTPVNTIY